MLKLESVSVAFPAAGGGIQPVDGVSLEVGETERHMIVGETGSGKSVLLTSILGLGEGRVTGRIVWNGRELTGLSEKEYSKIRGREIAYIPQSGGGSLNPLMKIGRQIGEPLEVRWKPCGSWISKGRSIGRGNTPTVSAAVCASAFWWRWEPSPAGGWCWRTSQPRAWTQSGGRRWRVCSEDSPGPRFCALPTIWNLPGPSGSGSRFCMRGRFWRAVPRRRFFRPRFIPILK